MIYHSANAWLLPEIVPILRFNAYAAAAELGGLAVLLPEIDLSLDHRSYTAASNGKVSPAPAAAGTTPDRRDRQGVELDRSTLASHLEPQ